MSPPIELGSNFQVWENALEAARQVVSKAGQTVKGTSGALLPLPIRLWRAQRDLKALVTLVSGSLDMIRKSPEGYAASPKMQPLVKKMFALCASIDDLYGTAKNRGFTNRTLTAAPLNLIKAYGETLFDHAETIFLIIDPTTSENARIALAERERGECFGMEIFS